MKQNLLRCLIFTFAFAGYGVTHAAGLLQGTWQEVWTQEDGTVDDEDHYYISYYKDQILINAISETNYALGQVTQNGKNLSFKMLNLDTGDGVFEMDYSCKETIVGRELKCQFTNQEGDTETNVIWKKIKS